MRYALKQKVGDSMASQKKLSVYLCFLLRHHPEAANLTMDRHGWISVQQLIENVNHAGKYELTAQQLDEIVRTDEKRRYRYSADRTRIKACQGHSIPWVEPELTYLPPPEFLYHGTTKTAWQKIQKSGSICKMERHAVHMQADEQQAWQSARRWHHPKSVVLKIAAKQMACDGAVFGVSDNDVWCTEKVDVRYICDVLE